MTITRFWLLDGQIILRRELDPGEISRSRLRSALRALSRLRAGRAWVAPGRLAPGVAVALGYPVRPDPAVVEPAGSPGSPPRSSLSGSTPAAGEVLDLAVWMRVEAHTRATTFTLAYRGTRHHFKVLQLSDRLASSSVRGLIGASQVEACLREYTDAHGPVSLTDEAGSRLLERLHERLGAHPGSWSADPTLLAGEQALLSHIVEFAQQHSAQDRATYDAIMSSRPVIITIGHAQPEIDEFADAFGAVMLDSPPADDAEDGGGTHA